MARGDSLLPDGSRPDGVRLDDVRRNQWLRDESLRATMSASAARAGFDVEDITVRLAGGRRLVRVVVDRDGGVDLDTAAELSRDLSAALDSEYDAALGEAAYTLEVTSRGVGASLTAPRHFRRAIGRLVTIVRVDGGALTARIARSDGATLVLLTGADGLEPMTMPLSEVASAKVEVEFSPPSERVAAALAAFSGPPASDTAPNGDAAPSADTAPDGDVASDGDAAPNAGAPGSEGDDAR